MGMMGLNPSDYVIIRTNSAGAFCGYIDTYDRHTRHIWIRECRRLWAVEKAFTLSAVAVYGIKKGKMSVVSPGPNSHILANVEEIIPCSDEAIKSLREFPCYEA